MQVTKRLKDLQTKGILVYGSLLNLQDFIPFQKKIPKFSNFKVSGLRRVFSQSPFWRKSENLVLNVFEDTQASMNGLLLYDLDQNTIEQLQKREAGYDLLEFEDSKSSFYYFKGKSELQNLAGLPSRTYLEICKQGALSHGTDFYEEFLASTFLLDGTSLKDY